MKYSTSPAYSFTLTKKLKLPKEDPLFTPGPQKYTPKKITLRSPTTIIGYAKRMSSKKESVPGPGAYNIPSLFPKGFKYSIGKQLLNRKNNFEKSAAPGPATYRPLSKSRSALYTFGLKPKEPKKEKSPGPGDYNLRNNKDLIKSSYIFGKEKRVISSITNYNRLTPGPGKYKYNKDAVKIRNPKYSFGKEERKNCTNNELSPGPGSYNHKEYLGKEGQKISISEKFKHMYSEINDIGPGQYNHTDLNFYKPKSPSMKIGKNKRFKTSKEFLISPGPAKYNQIKAINLIKNNEPRWKIGTAKRRPLIEIDRFIPGPGKYNLAKITGKDSPHYSMGLKTKLVKDGLNPPGPGKYNIDKADVDVYEHSPSWKIGTEKKIKSLKFYKNTPGPGSYTINSSRNFRPKFAFTNQKRGYLIINNYPGPGAYHIPCSFEELNSYTRIKGKFNDEFKFI